MTEAQGEAQSDAQAELARLRAEAAVLITATTEALVEAIRRCQCHHYADEMLVAVQEGQRHAARCTGPRVARVAKTKTENGKKLREAM